VVHNELHCPVEFVWDGNRDCRCADRGEFVVSGCGHGADHNGQIMWVESSCVGVELLFDLFLGGGIPLGFVAPSLHEFLDDMVSHGFLVYKFGVFPDVEPDRGPVNSVSKASAVEGDVRGIGFQRGVGSLLEGCVRNGGLDF